MIVSTTPNLTDLTMKLYEESKAKAELEILNRQKVFNVETVKDNNKLFRFYIGFENYEIFLMVLVSWAERQLLIWTT